jgi:predicted acyl esterase
LIFTSRYRYTRLPIDGRAGQKRAPPTKHFHSSLRFFYQHNEAFYRCRSCPFKSVSDFCSSRRGANDPDEGWRFVSSLLLSAVVYVIPFLYIVKLHTVIAYPRDFDASNKYTVIMDRSPYGAQGLELINDIYLPFGFVTVGQDMRGSGASEGNFTIWHSDADDSQDTGNWAVSQPWSNGKVFTFGASADGLAAFRTPDNQPEWLKAQYFIWTSSVGYEIIYPNGAYLQALADMWIRSTVPDQADDCLKTIAENEMKTEWWDALALTGKYYKVNYPAAFWSGWYDIFLFGNLAAFSGYNDESDSSVRHTAKIVVDPLGHCQGAAEYFPQNLIAGRTAVAVAQSFELYGVRPVTRTNIKNVTFYVMSSNDEAGLNAGQYWSSLEKWPAPTMSKWYLQADHSLSTSAPSDSSATSSFVHDPANPVPTMGGNNLQLPCGPLDQSGIDQRSDVIVFNSAPFSSDYAMTGQLLATLYVSSDAIDTDFMVRLSDVYPTGEVRLIQDNAVRMRWRNGGLTPLFMEKGQVYKADLTLWNTSYVMATGHALRVSIASSNYPRFDINRNNGILLADRKPEDVNVTATNVIYHSSQYPSYISLPQVKKAQIPEYKGMLKEVQAAYPAMDWEKVMREYPEMIRKAAYPY